MPELPEVETVCLGLSQTILNKTIATVIANRDHLRLPIDSAALCQFADKTVSQIKRRSKYIIIYFKNWYQVIIIHLGMSGRLHYHFKAVDNKLNHTHIEVHFTDKSVLHFIDPRRFGFIHVINKDKLELYWSNKKLGIEPLNDVFNAAYLYKNLSLKKVCLKTALLDQRIVAGLGNIYVCEALFLSNLSPLMLSNAVTLSQCQVLVKYIKTVLKNAIIAGGSTLRDHKKINGEGGYFQYAFNVYDQENKLCKVCSTGVIKRVVQNGRSTFYCNQCQINN